MCKLKPTRWYITDANLKNGQKILTRMLEFVRPRPCIINSSDFGSQKPQIKSHCSNYNSVVIVLTQWDKLTSWCSRLVSALVISIFQALRISCWIGRRWANYDWNLQGLLGHVWLSQTHPRTPQDHAQLLLLVLKRLIWKRKNSMLMHAFSILLIFTKKRPKRIEKKPKVVD